ncbi:PQQ-like domain containing protein [Nitzschia inconspicua]|uniref:PQQ-like domain containing protein n=1 Tax=Nitzschia inconspicua TaxID=303405 RepID=A0A9K3PTK3_9STRA|nr:PQQ-like domain containing protein [Nitzschia inconspicua]
MSLGEDVLSSPILWENLLWVVTSSSQDDEQNQNIWVLDSTKNTTDCVQSRISLPVRVAADPLLWSRAGTKRTHGSTAAAILIYSSSDWDAGLILVDLERKCLMFSNDGSSGMFFAGEIGPVHNAMAIDSQTGAVIISDSLGSVHKVNLETLTISSKKIANCALSSPFLVTDSCTIIIGGYDGRVRCLSNDLDSMCWSIDAFSTVCARPLVLMKSENVVVCTTAGDVSVLNIFTGKEQWRYRLPIGGEIWSDPIEIPLNSLAAIGTPRRVCFGARDSRLHLLNVPTSTSAKHEVC